MEIARYWRLNNQRYTLTGSVCSCCGKQYFSPRPICDACQDEARSAKATSREMVAPAYEPANR